MIPKIYTRPDEFERIKELIHVLTESKSKAERKRCFAKPPKGNAITALTDCLCNEKIQTGLEVFFDKSPLL